MAVFGLDLGINTYRHHEENSLDADVEQQYHVPGFELGFFGVDTLALAADEEYSYHDRTGEDGIWV